MGRKKKIIEEVIEDKNIDEAEKYDFLPYKDTDIEMFNEFKNAEKKICRTKTRGTTRKEIFQKRNTRNVRQHDIFRRRMLRNHESGKQLFRRFAVRTYPEPERGTRRYDKSTCRVFAEIFTEKLQRAQKSRT